MKFQQIQLDHVRESLRTQAFCGKLLHSELPLSSLYKQTTISQNSSHSTFLSKQQDWASISYVQTNSALETGTMPQWVAEDIESVLDNLIIAKVLKTKAVWFDKLGQHQYKDWPILATLHSIAAPIIFVPPTRTREYSRFQIPDHWDVLTASIVYQMEEILQECQYCGPKAPQPFDSRLLNIAGCLRAWSVNEAMIANSCCGAFISQTSKERFEYTIAWYGLLLQILLDVLGFGHEVYERSVELYGEPLFRPCNRCMDQIRYLTIQHPSLNCSNLEHALCELQRHADRFILPSEIDTDNETDPPSSNTVTGNSQSSSSSSSEKSTTKIRTSAVLSQRELEALATNILRGRSASYPCYREGDKWLCGLILTNLEQFLRSFKSVSSLFEEQTKKQMQRLLKMEKPFTEVTTWGSDLPELVNYCKKCPPCDGQQGEICLFNELSGSLRPSSVGEFLSDRGFDEQESEEILKSVRNSMRRRIQVQGIAYLCYEVKNEVIRSYALRNCAACCKDYELLDDEEPKKLLLLGWRSGHDTYGQDNQSESADYVVYSFITIDVNGSRHVHSRGNISPFSHMKCYRCPATFIRLGIEGAHEQLEIHTGTTVSTASATSLVFDALDKSHNV